MQSVEDYKRWVNIPAFLMEKDALRERLTPLSLFSIESVGNLLHRRDFEINTNQTI